MRIFFGYKNDTSDPAFRGIISIMEVVFHWSPSVIPTDFGHGSKLPLLISRLECRIPCLDMKAKGRTYGCLLFRPTVPPAGLLLDRPKSNQKGAGTYGFPSSLYASGNRLRHPWPSVWRPGLGFRCPLRWATAIFHPRKEASPAFILEGGGYMKQIAIE